MTHLCRYPLHDPIHQLARVGQQLWRRALVDPCSRERLQVECRLRDGWAARDGGEDVGYVSHRGVSRGCVVVLEDAADALLIAGFASEVLLGGRDTRDEHLNSILLVLGARMFPAYAIWSCKSRHLTC